VDKDRKIDARHVAAEDMPEPPPSTTTAPLGRREAAGPAVSGPAPPPARSRRAEPEHASEAAPEPEPELEPETVAPPPPASEARAEKPAAPRQRRETSPPAREARPEPRDRGRRPTIQPARPTDTPRRGRSRGWIWTWAVVILLMAAGAWALFGDELPFTAGRAGGRTPATTTAPVRAATPSADDGGDAGASQLAMTPPAEATPDRPAETEAAPPAAAAVTRHWVHVASFRDQDRAARYRDLLGATGAAVSVRQVTLGDGETWQRVLLGPFASEAEADAAAAALEAQGLVTFHRQIAE
jgi:hypothetical protein